MRDRKEKFRACERAQGLQRPCSEGLKSEEGECPLLLTRVNYCEGSPERLTNADVRSGDSYENETE